MIDQDVPDLSSIGNGFIEAVKWFMPRLLLTPIWHASQCVKYVKTLTKLSTSQEERGAFERVTSELEPMKLELEKRIAEIPE